MGEQAYNELLAKNKKFENFIELSLLKPIFNEVIKKVVYMDEDEKKKLEENSKKF